MEPNPILMLGEIRGTLAAVREKVDDLVATAASDLRENDESRRRLYERVERSEQRSEVAFRSHAEIIAQIAEKIGSATANVDANTSEVETLKKKLQPLNWQPQPKLVMSSGQSG